MEPEMLPKENMDTFESSSLNGDEVVISGISGVFPSSDNVQEFMENLYNKVDMVVAVDPLLDLAEMPRHQGKISGIDKFDAQFFRVTFNQAMSMDPQCRKVLEHAYSAIYDSGNNPLDFQGSNLGVFVGTQYIDSLDVWFYDTKKLNSLVLAGCSKTMMPNRISYWINGKATSCAVDYACASSLACLQAAYHCIVTGQCDSAIVGGCNINLLPTLSVNMRRAGLLCLDGKTKCFDNQGDGYVRSDAVTTLFLQKAKDAKRIYSQVYHAKVEYGLKQGDEFTPARSTDRLVKFFEEFYSEIDVSPDEVEYVEANAAAIAEADGNEMEAIGRFFGKKGPIKIGSVKSNMGNSEPASGGCSVTKVCLAYHTGKIPGNLHYSEPQNHIPSVRDGRIEVIQDNIPFKRGFTAINNFSFTGIDVHVLLKGHYKPKDTKRYKSNIPYLINVSGRQEDCVNKMIKNLETLPVDPEYIALLHNINKRDTPNHTSRGYVILDVNETSNNVVLSKSISYYAGDVRPVCFMYSGMGSQWPGMGADLLRIPTFRRAIEKCQNILEPMGVDIIKVICDTNKHIFDNVLHSFVGIAAVQIGLTDVLKDLGIVPDIVIGHSLGEMGCAYADGCFTAEETILTAYGRGKGSAETDFICGAMAAVGLGFKDILPLVPPEIDIACHNSSESATISGPADAVANFVKELKSKGIFAKEVPCSNISYHSRYVTVAAPNVMKYLKEFIKNPKPRSPKWLCTSYPRERWEDPVAKYSSAEFHVNNLLSPVYFEETTELIPPNAIIIEIAPHGLLQAILKRSHAECINIPLTRRANSDPVNFLLQAVGKLYESGLNPNISELYPKIEYPVSTETPFLSHFVEWEHEENWYVAKKNETKMVTTSSREFVMSIQDDECSFMKDYVRNGVYVFPESACLVLVWETLAMSMGINYRDLSVEFNNLKFHGEVIIKNDAVLKFKININKIENSFEVVHEGVPLLTGVIKQYYKLKGDPTKHVTFYDAKDLTLNSQDIYKLLTNRGYFVKDKFLCIDSANIDCDKATVRWTGEWVTFLDSLLQLNILNNGHKCISTPKLIQELKIDVSMHPKIRCEETCLNAELQTIYGLTRCGGVEIRNIVFKNILTPEKDPDVLSNKAFFSYFPKEYYNIDVALTIHLQIVAENIKKDKIKLSEINPTCENTILKHIKDIEQYMPLNFNVDDEKNNLQDFKYHDESNVNELVDLFVTYNLFEDKQVNFRIRSNLRHNGFVLALEKTPNIKEILNNKQFIVISAIRLDKDSILILLKGANNTKYVEEYIAVKKNYGFSWLKRIKEQLNNKKRVVLVSINQSFNGLTGIVETLSREYGNRIGILSVNDVNAAPFKPENNFYKEQLEKQLIINILHKGEWGGFYRMPIIQPKKTHPCDLTIEVPMDFNTLKWTEISSPPSSKVTIEVHYASLSGKDIQTAMGIDVNESRRFGMDFSGIDVNGNKVMGLICGGSLADTIAADPDLLWPVPSHWSMKEAATVPLAFVHAYYCLVMRAELYKGKVVVINGGAGPLGQAVISLCLAFGHDIRVTVGDSYKKQLLLRLFPELKSNHIYSSKDENFAALLRSEPEKMRRNVVINCASGYMRKVAMSCVGLMGYFLDLNTEDIRSNETIGMHFINMDRNYRAVNLSNIFQPNNVLQRKELQRMISDGIVQGIVKPLTCVEYLPEDITKAFRLLSSRKHRGRVLINMKDKQIKDSAKIRPRITCSSHNAYIIVCDSKELGLEVIDLLLMRGARNIVLHLKTDAITGYCKAKIASWKKQKANINLLFDEIESEQGCNNIIDKALAMGPIEGIFIVLDRTEETNDNIFKKGDLPESCNKLLTGVLNLEVHSRYSLMDSLRHFVVITQSSKNIVDEYVNSVSEEVCRARNALNLPGLIIRAEYVNQETNNGNEWIQPQNISVFLRGLEKSIKLNLTSVQTFNINGEKILNWQKDIFEHALHNSGKSNGVLKENLSDDILNSNGHIDENNNISHENIISQISSKLRKEDKNNQKTNFGSGLGAFYTVIDEDLYTATEPLITMSTKIVNKSEMQSEVDPNADYLLMIPGFDGHHKIYEFLSERLKIKAVTIQIDPESKHDSIKEIAKKMLTVLKKRLRLKEKFYLLGYSFGVNVALELAALLEMEDHVGVVICLDSSPDILRAQIDAYIGNSSNIQLQNIVLRHMFRLITGNSLSEMKNDITEILDWPTKINLFVNQVKETVTYSHQYIKSVLDSAYQRILLARNYNPTLNLKSELLLIKGIPHPDCVELPHDYNLSKYTKHPVNVFTIESDHSLAPYDSQVTNIINKMLDPKILEEFQKMSSCEVYFY